MKRYVDNAYIIGRGDRAYLSAIFQNDSAKDLISLSPNSCVAMIGEYNL